MKKEMKDGEISLLKSKIEVNEVVAMKEINDKASTFENQCEESKEHDVALLQEEIAVLELVCEKMCSSDDGKVELEGLEISWTHGRTLALQRTLCSTWHLKSRSKCRSAQAYLWYENLREQERQRDELRRQDAVVRIQRATRARLRRQFDEVREQDRRRDERRRAEDPQINEDRRERELRQGRQEQRSSSSVVRIGQGVYLGHSPADAIWILWI